mgnify:CR=1 FL=1
MGNGQPCNAISNTGKYGTTGEIPKNEIENEKARGKKRGLIVN